MSFDTIRFKLLNLSDYTGLAFNLTKGERVTIGGMKYREMSNRWEEIKEDEFIQAKLTSASYDINFSINLVLNFVLFEFSIPKYIYGHNLLQFPLSGGNEHDDLKTFVERFFLHEFKAPVKFSDIEIQRLDFCLNYEFQTIENKEQYKHHMGDMLKRKFGEHAVLSYSDNDTVMFKTQDYSFKLYDKGKEFLKHDYKKIHAYYGKQKAEELAEKASKIIRAEITYRKRKISYEFFNDIRLTTQVSDSWKSRFIILKKERDESISLLDSVARKLNGIVRKGWNDDKIRDEVKKLKTSKWLLYSQCSFEPVIATAKRIREKNKFSFTDYTNADLKMLLKRRYQDKIKEYNVITAPKQIKLELTKFERAFIRTTRPQIIELDEELLTRLFKKFKDILLDVNNFQLSNVTPLMALNIYRNHVAELGFNINSLRKFLTARQAYSNRELINRKIYSKSQVYLLSSQLKKLDAYVKFHGSKVGVFNMKIPEKISLDKEVSIQNSG